MQYSKFWFDDKTKKKVKRGEKDLPHLASVKSAIGRFVSILTGENIPVEFYKEGDQSFTDGNKVVISADINTDTIDQTVGTALHEASHIVLTDFNVIKNLPQYVPKSLEDKAEKKFRELDREAGSDDDNFSWLDRIIKHIFNYIEDRRIDNYVFTRSPGYKGYYHSMYDAYWHSEEVTEKLNSDQFREENMSSYMTRIINLTNPNSDLDALDELRKINRMIDLDNINRFNNSREVLNTAINITEILIDAVDDINFDEKDQFDIQVGDGKEEDCESIDLDDLSEQEKEKLKEEIEKQLDFMDGDIQDEEDMEPLSQQEAEEVDTLEDCDVSSHDVGEGSGNPHTVPCVVIDRITPELIRSQSFGNIKKTPPDLSRKAVKEGRRLGRMLGKKLQIRSDKRVTEFKRRKQGDLDGNMLAELEYNQRIFTKQHVDEYTEAFIHISVDASGSMSSDKWFNAHSMAVAVAKACSMIDNIRVQISYRTTNSLGFTERGNKPLILLAYDSNRDGFNHVKQFFPHITSRGTTPEGLCFEATLNRLVDIYGGDEMDAYFVNLSDGLPNFSSSDFTYRGEVGAKHTNKIVNEIRKKGFQILSYYIDGSNNPSSNSTFDTMYGNDAEYISVDNVTQIAKSMNDKFTDKGDFKYA